MFRWVVDSWGFWTSKKPTCTTFPWVSVGELMTTEYTRSTAMTQYIQYCGSRENYLVWCESQPLLDLQHVSVFPIRAVKLQVNILTSLSVFRECMLQTYSFSNRALAITILAVFNILLPHLRASDSVNKILRRAGSSHRKMDICGVCNNLLWGNRAVSDSPSRTVMKYIFEYLTQILPPNWMDL